jgi:hypothetical protein
LNDIPVAVGECAHAINVIRERARDAQHEHSGDEEYEARDA